MKAVWEVGQELGQEASQRHPEGQCAIGVNLLKTHRKPGANISAVTFPSGMIGMLQHVAPEIMEPLIEGKLGALFVTAAERFRWSGSEQEMR